MWCNTETWQPDSQNCLAATLHQVTAFFAKPRSAGWSGWCWSGWCWSGCLNRLPCGVGLLDLSQTAEMPRVHPRLLTSADICGQDIFMWVTEARRKTFNRLSPSCFRKGPTCAQRGYSGSTDWMRKTLTLQIGMTWMTVVTSGICGIYQEFQNRPWLVMADFRMPWTSTRHLTPWDHDHEAHEPKPLATHQRQVLRKAPVKTVGQTTVRWRIPTENQWKSSINFGWICPQTRGAK